MYVLREETSKQYVHGHYNQSLLVRTLEWLIQGSGAGGIRTHGGVTLTCFQDRTLRPLGNGSMYRLATNPSGMVPLEPTDTITLTSWSDSPSRTACGDTRNRVRQHLGDEVPRAGIEPAPPKRPGLESGVYTSFTTRALPASHRSAGAGRTGCGPTPLKRPLIV